MKDCWELLHQSMLIFTISPVLYLTNSKSIIKCSSRSINGFDIGNLIYLAIQKNNYKGWGPLNGSRL